MSLRSILCAYRAHRSGVYKTVSPQTHLSSFYCQMFLMLFPQPAVPKRFVLKDLTCNEKPLRAHVVPMGIIEAFPP